MREDRPMWLNAGETERPSKRVNVRSWLLLLGWLAPLVLWIAVLAFLKFNTGVATKAMLLTSASLAVVAAFVRRHNPTRAWRRARSR